MACTTILVGKKASFDGSTLVARNEDSPSGVFTPKKFIVVKPEDQVTTYKSILSKVEIDLPNNPMRYTCMPNADPIEGVWGAFGVNEKNVSMTATETITSNEMVLAADPLVVHIKEKGKKGDPDYEPEIAGGIGEEDMVTITLPYIHTAREGVMRLGSLIEKYGTYEMNGIAFQDENEIWWFETIGGHNWMARRVPDDYYVIMPNQLGIDFFDFDDAYGKDNEFLCSKSLKPLTEKYFLNLCKGKFNPRVAYGSHSDSDHTYNTPRAWALMRYFNPSTYKWDGPAADYTPESDNIPWMLIPEKKITIYDIKYALSNHYQGTPYDCYSKHSDEKQKNKFRPIGINRNNVMGLVQIRPYMPKELKAIQWLSLGCNVYNTIVPFYTHILDTPKYLRDTTNQVTTDDFYWTNRIIAALADPHFQETASHIERYQLKSASQTLQLLHQADEEFQTHKPNDPTQFLQKANDKIATQLKKETDDLLSKVLYSASCKMKNSFARSDA